MRADRSACLAVALAALQLLDATGNAVASHQYLDAHFAHLGVSDSLRRTFQPIKIASSATLLIGAKRHRVRVVTAA